MRCQKARFYLSAYCKNELSDKRHQAVSAHLHVCPECRKEEAAVKELVGSCSKIRREKVSEDFNAKLLDRIAQERFQETRTKAFKPKNSPVFGWARIVPAAATACLILAFVMTGGIGILNQDPGEPVLIAEVNNDDYFTAEPTNNPNIIHHSGNNQGAFIAHKNSQWEFKKELARVNRMKNYMNSLAGYSNDFGGQQTRLSSIISNPEMPTIVMRLPFGQRVSGNQTMVSGSR